MAAFMIVFYDEDTDLDLVNTYEITRYDQYLNCITTICKPSSERVAGSDV